MKKVKNSPSNRKRNNDLKKLPIEHFHDMAESSTSRYILYMTTHRQVKNQLTHINFLFLILYQVVRIHLVFLNIVMNPLWN